MCWTKLFYFLYFLGRIYSFCVLNTITHSARPRSPWSQPTSASPPDHTVCSSSRRTSPWPARTPSGRTRHSRTAPSTCVCPVDFSPGSNARGRILSAWSVRLGKPRKSATALWIECPISNWLALFCSAHKSLESIKTNSSIYFSFRVGINLGGLVFLKIRLENC